MSGFARSKLILPVLFACVVWASAGGLAAAGGRVALVIGNAEYHLPSLRLGNPGNDARAVAAKLESLRFDVILRTDLAREKMVAALGKFSAMAEGADMAVVFFAGHGIQMAGENYLLGTDFTELTVDALPSSSLALSELQKAVAAADPEIGVVIIDACRNNPFAEQGVVTPGLARASGGAGLLFAYSTDPGNVAFDGDGRHSQFTAALLRHMGTPGLDVRLMFGRIRQNVIRETNGKQIPWVEESVLGTYSLSTTPPQPPSTEVAREIARWREISGMPGTEPYRKFLAEFPSGLFAEFAEQRLRNPMTTQADVDPGRLDSDSRPTVVAALSVLGFLPPVVRGASPADNALRRAVDAYAAQSGAGGDDFDAHRLYMDAARTLTLLGAKTAQRLRTDIAMLAAVDTAAGVAEGALAEIRTLADTNPAAEPILAQATADMAAIDAERAKIQERLDAARSYYADLLETSRGRFEPLIRSVAATITKDDRATDRAGGDETSDLRLFVDHVVRPHDPAKEGSYAWMIDFLPD